MIVIPSAALRELMMHIVEVTHMLCDENGEPYVCGTIDGEGLRTAAIIALMSATRMELWPGDKTIVIRRPKIHHGIFREEG